MEYSEILIWVVILAHVVFAGMQAFRWPFVAKRLLNIEDPEAIAKTATVGKSFASYNFSIAIGLGLSFWISESVARDVQLTVMVFIVFTAVVGFLGTRSNVILLGRLLPAVATVLLLIIGF
jgi:uncharacterized membrane protein